MAASLTSQWRRASVGGEQSPCAYNLEPLDNDDEEAALRAEDFLNDKLQAFEDFTSYEALIANVEAQRVQLDSQLQAAQLKLDAAQRESADHLGLMRQQADKFNAQQSQIDQRLHIVTSSNAPDEAIELFKTPMDQTRKIEIAQLYLKLLEEVDTLSGEARKQLPGNPKDALVPYTRLRGIAKALLLLQKPTEGAAAHLVDFVNGKADALWQEMQNIMSKQFRAILTSMNYPAAQLEPSEEFASCFDKMLDLQEPEFGSAQEAVILLPFSVLTEQFRERYWFHFLGDRATNQKHNPQTAFDWPLNLFPEWHDSLRANVTPLLVRRFKDTKYADNSLYMDAYSAFIASFLPVIKDKADQFLSRTASEPQYMSKFVQSLLAFDSSMRDDIKYDGGDLKNGWKGTAAEVLATWFDAWMAAEKQFALGRYQDIVQSADSGSIDFDSGMVGRTKTTFGASKVMDLLNGITLLYEPLQSFSYKLRFLIDVQLSILDQFHGRLASSIDAYKSMTSTVGRTLHGVTKEEQAMLDGIGGLESLCKVYGSADHVINELQDQSNNVFFVDLWAELQRRARKRDTDDHLAGPMTYSDVRSSTSSAVGSEEDGAVFDETSEAFIKLRKHAEILMAEDVEHSLARLFRPYFQKPQWLSIEGAADDDSEIQTLHITAELDQPLQALKARLDLLHKMLSSATLRRVWRRVSLKLQDQLWQNIVMHSRFTVTGGRQFARDQKAIIDMIEGYIPDSSNSVLGMLKIQESAKLLSLPLVGRDAVPSVSEAYNRVMTDNSHAKAFVDELGFRELDYNDARKVLEHRVEATE